MIIWRFSMRGICSTLVCLVHARTRIRSSTLDADVLVRHLAAAEAERDLHLVALVQEGLFMARIFTW